MNPLYEKGCVYHFLTPTPGIVEYIEGLEDIENWPCILDCGLTIKKGDIVSEVRIGSDRSGFVITGAETREEAFACAIEAEKKINVVIKKILS